MLFWAYQWAGGGDLSHMIMNLVSEIAVCPAHACHMTDVTVETGAFE